MQMPPDIKEELIALQNRVTDIHLRHQIAAKREAEPLIERITLIHDTYPSPLVVDISQIQMPFIEGEF